MISELLTLDFFTGDRLLGRCFNEASAKDLGICCGINASCCLIGEVLSGLASKGSLESSSGIFHPFLIKPSVSGIIGSDKREATIGGFGVSTRSTTSALSKQPSASLAASDQRLLEDLTAVTEVPNVVRLELAN